MKYEGYIFISRTTGKVVGGYPRPGEALYHTRLGDDLSMAAAVKSGEYIITRVEGEV